MVRAPFYDKNGLKKGAWSREEDERLRAYIQRHGHSNWRQLPKFAGIIRKDWELGPHVNASSSQHCVGPKFSSSLARCGKSCRLRWLNYLRQNLKHGNYTREEEEIIIKLHQQLGNKWSLIAEKLPGRTDNEIKNYWHSHLKKWLKGKENTTSELKSKPGDNLEGNATHHQFVRPDQSPAGSDVGADDFHHHILESSIPVSTETSEGGIYSPTSSTSFAQSSSTMNCPRTKEDSVAPWVTTFEEFGGDFWTEPFVVEDAYATTNEICCGEGIALLIPNFYDSTYLFQNLEDFA